MKKGETFAIHDVFSAVKYGDMHAFVKKLKEMGYEKVDLIDLAIGIKAMRVKQLTFDAFYTSLVTGRF